MTTTKQRRNIQKEVAEKLIDRIKSKGLMPWECPWTRIPGSNLMPINFATRQPYSGINVFLLWSEAQEKGYTQNLWMTANQANKLGGQIRKGEKSVLCVRYGRYKKEVKNERTGEEEEKTFIYSKGFSLFNVEQVEGVEVDGEEICLTVDSSESVANINRIAQTLADNTGLNLSVAGDQAYFSPVLDKVNMPAREFESPEAYVATYAHELTHSTGHWNRLDRFSEFQGRFDTHNEDYAFEELIAEMGSAFVCAELGVQGRHEQHASYLGSWIKHLETDYRYLTQAASAASKAHSFIMKGGVTSEENQEQPKQPEGSDQLQRAA